MALNTKQAVELIKHKALTDLGIARRERLAKQDYDVYLDALAGWSGDAVREACRRLSVTPRGEYEPTFPPLSLVLEYCQTVQREAEIRKQLNAPRRRDDPPISQEKFDAFMAQIRAAIGRKAMR